MKIIIKESKRDMLFKKKFKELFDELTPTRFGINDVISYVFFDETIMVNDSVVALVYAPGNRKLIVFPNYFTDLRYFVSSDKELEEMIAINYEELTGRIVSFIDILETEE